MNTEKLTAEQQKLVEAHMQLVRWIISDHVTVNEGICGLGFSDLFQEGCLALIRAARGYDTQRGSFEAFARKVIRNGLWTYCKRICCRQKMMLPSGGARHEDGNEDAPSLLDSLAALDDTDLMMDGIRIIELLESFLPEYTGVARKGIEAIILKVKGYNGADIARMYGVDQYNVGAWIRRAKLKLLANERFAASL